MKTTIRNMMTYLANWRAECAKTNDVSTLMDVENVQDSTRAIEAEAEQAARMAHKAETSTVEAVRTLSVAIADHHLTDSEIPLIEAALRHVKAATRTTHDLGEQLSS